METNLAYQEDEYGVGDHVRIDGNSLKIVSIEDRQVTLEIETPEGVEIKTDD